MQGRWKRALAVAAALAATAGLATGAALAATAGPSADTVKVGVIYSRTGLLAAYGAEYIEGLKLGLQYVTKGTNTIGGKKVELVIADDGTDPAKAVSATKDMIGQGIKIVVGTVSSGVALQLGPLAQQNNVLYISGPAASDAITGLNRNTFRSGRQTIQDVKAAASFLTNPGRKVLVFAQDTVFGQGNYDAVSAFIGSKGHTVSKLLVPASATDFTPFARQAKDAHPDLLFVAWAGTTGAAMWKALDQQGVLSSTTVTTGLAERATWSTFGNDVATKIKFLSHYVSTAPDNKVNDWLVAKLRARNQAPDLFTPDGFVAAQMLGRAIAKGGGSDVGKMISSLEGWQFLAPKGIQRIRPEDHAMMQPMFQVQLVVGPNGKLRPKVLKTISPGNVAPPIVPFK